MQFKELRDVLNKYLFVSDKMVNSVLDVGCGRGYGSFIISPFHIEILGIDPKQENIWWAEKHLRNENLHFEQKDYFQAHTFGRFDGVLFLDSIKKFAEPAVYFKYLFYLYDNCVNFGGKLIFDYPEYLEDTCKQKFLTQQPTYYPEHNLISITKDFNNRLKNIRL